MSVGRGLCRAHYTQFGRGGEEALRPVGLRFIHRTEPCALCGKPVTRQPSQFKCKTVFCSHAHYTEFYRNKMDGRKSPAWKGGRLFSADGYITLNRALFSENEQAKLAPMFTGPGSGIVREHRAVMALHLGRALLPTESVHHRNGDKTDNRIENLELIGENVDHVKLHKDLLAEVQKLRRENERLKALAK